MASLKVLSYVFVHFVGIKVMGVAFTTKYRPSLTSTAGYTLNLVQLDARSFFVGAGDPWEY